MTQQCALHTTYHPGCGQVALTVCCRSECQHSIVYNVRDE